MENKQFLKLVKGNMPKYIKSEKHIVSKKRMTLKDWEKNNKPHEWINDRNWQDNKIIIERWIDVAYGYIAFILIFPEGQTPISVSKNIFIFNNKYLMVSENLDRCDIYKLI